MKITIEDNGKIITIDTSTDNISMSDKKIGRKLKPGEFMESVEPATFYRRI